jgi:hypothetical protein
MAGDACMNGEEQLKNVEESVWANAIVRVPTVVPCRVVLDYSMLGQ